MINVKDISMEFTQQIHTTKIVHATLRECFSKAIKETFFKLGFSYDMKNSSIDS